MSEKFELKLLRSIKTGKGLIKLITNLKKNRRNEKIKGVKRKQLTPSQRKAVLEKTGCRCHICGIELTKNDFQADHVKPHSSGGGSTIDNYLPACFTCNNYRWHYTPEEIQIILKLGVWAKTKTLSDTELGLQIANSFVKHEMEVRKRRDTKNS